MNVAYFIQQCFWKCCIILFWLSVIFGFLYLPAIFHRAQSDRSINVATWSDMIDEEMLQKFQDRTGITVNLSYFDNNDELLVKIRATRGEGYDLIIPTDYAIQQLISDDLLQPLDKKKFLHWNRIIPRLLDCYFDPGNQFSIPYYWGIYGLAVDLEFFGEHAPKNSWELLFKQPYNNANVVMLDTPRETILLTAQYLFGSIDHLDATKRNAIKALLIEQKKWVEAYTEFRADYLLLSKASPIIVITTPFVWRLMKVNPHVQFLVPQQGTFMVTDNWVIPKASKKPELVYELLNFLYEPETISFHFDTYTFFPATIDLSFLLQSKNVNASVYNAHFDESYKMDFFRNVISKAALNDIWISLKAS